MPFGEPHTPPEPWVGAEVVAEYLGTTRQSVYRWIELARLPVHYVGNRPLRRFRLSEIDAWIEDNYRFKRTDSPAGDAVDGAVA